MAITLDQINSITISQWEDYIEKLKERKTSIYLGSISNTETFWRSHVPIENTPDFVEDVDFD